MYISKRTPRIICISKCQSKSLAHWADQKKWTSSKYGIFNSAYNSPPPADNGHLIMIMFSINNPTLIMLKFAYYTCCDICVWRTDRASLNITFGCFWMYIEGYVISEELASYYITSMFTFNSTDKYKATLLSYYNKIFSTQFTTFWHMNIHFQILI